MKIYWFKAQAPQRVLALVKYLGIKTEFIELDLMGGELQKPEYAHLNPNKKAPTLVDGDIVLWEASAIMAYLSIQAKSDLWPSANPLEQVEVIRWLSWNDCHWSTVVAPFYFEHVVKKTFGMGAPNYSLLKDSVTDFRKFAKVLDEHLAGKNYVALNRLTIADFQLASMATYWKQSEMPLNDFSNIKNWLEVLNRLPAWSNPWPAA